MNNCPEDCKMCSGQWCVKHGSNACYCTRYERHYLSDGPIAMTNRIPIPVLFNSIMNIERP